MSTNHYLFLVSITLLAGCADSGRQAAELARQAASEQADQNRRMADANKVVAEGSKRLIEAEAQARQELIELQQDLRQDQADTGRQRDLLEAERKSFASARERESLLASVIISGGLVLACLSPLVLAGMALWQARQPTSDDETSEVLIGLLQDPAPTALGHFSVPERLQLPGTSHSQSP